MPIVRDVSDVRGVLGGWRIARRDAPLKPDHRDIWDAWDSRDKATEAGVSNPYRSGEAEPHGGLREILRAPRKFPETQ
jgi:hypothetical protein